MNEIIAYCGLPCHTCPIYLATREKNTEEKAQMKVEIAQQSNKLYDTKYKPEDICNCDGCTTKQGRLFEGCRRCEIRKCAISKTVENCAYCETYPCEKLEIIFKVEQTAKKRLDEIKNNLSR
jgi:hypothetical protein